MWSISILRSKVCQQQSLRSYTKAGLMVQVVVIGEDSWSRDREFESQSRIRQSYKRYTIVKYDSRVELTKNPPIVNYDR